MGLNGGGKRSDNSNTLDGWDAGGAEGGGAADRLTRTSLKNDDFFDFFSLRAKQELNITQMFW
jgi:hypothetical protein